jgi:hypothetical protein
MVANPAAGGFREGPYPAARICRRADSKDRCAAAGTDSHRPALAHGVLEGAGVELEWHAPPVAAGAGDMPGASGPCVVGLIRNERA